MRRRRLSGRRGREHPAPRPGHVHRALLPAAQLRPGRALRAQRQGPAKPERHLDGEARLHHPAGHGRRSRSGGRQPAVDLRPRPARRRHRGQLDRAEDARPGARLRLLRDRHDRLLDRRHPEHHRHPQRLLELPRAHRPRAAGDAQLLYLGRLMIHPQGLTSNPVFHVDATTSRARRRSTPSGCTTTATARAASSAARSPPSRPTSPAPRSGSRR